VAEKAAYTLDTVAQQVRSWKAQGLKVVFTNGVFDVLHVGHVEVLEVAASHGQKLVVGVNSDASVRRLRKGPDRPIHEEGNRARVLAALRSVDAVVVFEDDTPLALVNSLQPDVLVKGGDYDAACTDENDPRYMVGSAELKAWGGHAVAVPLVPGQSTTATIKKIRTS